MKIILSRKGYDDQYGGKPSIILSNGKMLSFPIPTSGPEEYGVESHKLKFEGLPLSKYFEDLGHSKFNLFHHVDPDINGLYGDKEMGAFGQAGAALTHLQKNKVGAGDLFLFFGTFCKTKSCEGKIQYEPMHSIHAIYGYLLVDRVVTTNEIENEMNLSWLKQHPHYINKDFGDHKKNNSIFIGKNYGYFNFNSVLQLTKPGYHKSWWSLPLEFKDVSMTYHDSCEKRINNDHCEIRSVAKGQEFVFEMKNGLQKWLEEVLSNATDRKVLSYSD